MTINLTFALIQDNIVEDSMNVDPKHHRYFVARRGQVLRDLAEEYGGVMVSFPRTGSQSDKVTLKGAKDCVEAAKKRMLEIVEDLVRSGAAVFRTLHDLRTPNLTSSVSTGCASYHGVCDFTKVPSLNHGTQRGPNSADHPRSQCADQVPGERRSAG